MFEEWMGEASICGFEISPQPPERLRSQMTVISDPATIKPLLKGTIAKASVVLLLFLLAFSFCASAQTAPQQNTRQTTPAPQTADIGIAAERHRFASGILLSRWTDIPFDGRDEWEHRLYDKLFEVKAFQMKNPGVVRANSATPATEDEKKQFATLTKESLELINEGVLRAVEERRNILLTGGSLSTPELVDYRRSLMTPELLAYRRSLMNTGNPHPTLWVAEADQELAKRGLRFEEKTHSIQPIQKNDKKQ